MKPHNLLSMPAKFNREEPFPMGCFGRFNKAAGKLEEKDFSTGFETAQFCPVPKLVWRHAMRSVRSGPDHPKQEAEDHDQQ
jgi:hypothetical protein